MPKGFSNTDHLKQGEGRSRKTRKSGSHTAQGPWGASKKKASGSHLQQGEGGAKPRGDSGSHLTPHPALTDKTSDKQGGTKRGHDRTNPNAGKRKAGNHLAQHPNVKTKK